VKIAERSDRERKTRKPNAATTPIITPSSSGGIVSRAATAAYRDGWDRIFGREAKAHPQHNGDGSDPLV